ncbi:hypothetical protein K1T71_000375 [Dendrolimus kikuchii]|uniref:Uncharacterized protein n=1 Tax=Dendrolimus kikuchii TaxID=765133 RepID=A0ACC1DKJ0_9NEOP|nr:hypothetical protein K1T71_000375 [Dendrolimus kikuchii]
MALPEQFSLRWNDFQANIAQAFLALLGDEDLSDVTLSAEGHNIRAHKLILSVGSPYFKELFKKTPCSHPVVILKDVTHKELCQLLQFMYRGEVNVCQQELSSFLNTAELLQIKGLTVGREQSPKSPEYVVQEEVRANALQDQMNDSIWLFGDEEAMPEVVPELVENPALQDEAAAVRSPLKRLLKTTTRKNDALKKKVRNTNDNMQQVENSEIMNYYEPLPEDRIKNSSLTPEAPKEPGFNCKPSVAKCPSCNRYFANRYNLKVHIRDKHAAAEGSLTCTICQKTMRNPSCLRVHLYNHRKQAAYLAQFCTQGDNFASGDLLKKCGMEPAAPVEPVKRELETSTEAITPELQLKRDKTE